MKAKVAPQNTREKRQLNGMQKYGKCVICSLVMTGNVIKSENFTWKINKKVSCNNSIIVYLIGCQKERQTTYIRLTTKTFTERMCLHLGYVRN